MFLNILWQNQRLIHREESHPKRHKHPHPVCNGVKSYYCYKFTTYVEIGDSIFFAFSLSADKSRSGDCLRLGHSSSCFALRFVPSLDTNTLGWSDRKWQPTPVFLPEKFCGQRSLAGCSPQSRGVSVTTEQLSTHTLSDTLQPNVWKQFLKRKREWEWMSIGRQRRKGMKGLWRWLSQPLDVGSFTRIYQALPLAPIQGNEMDATECRRPRGEKLSSVHLGKFIYSSLNWTQKGNQSHHLQF